MLIIRFFAAILILPTVMFSAAIAEPLRTPIFNDGEKLRYKITGVRNMERVLGAPQPIEFMNSFQRVRDESGRKVIRQISRETRDNHTAVNWRFDYADTYPATRCLNFSRTLVSPRQTEVFSEYASFDDPFLKFPENIVHPVALPFLLAGISGQNKTPADLYTWAQDGRPTHMFVDSFGEESVTVPAGTFKARKVRIRVDRKEVIEPWGAFGKLIAGLIPEFVFWYDNAPPNRLVRIKVDWGGSGVPGSPLYYQELVEIK